jgi:replication factor A1
MVESNYSNLIELISQNSGIPLEEIERKIEAKQAKLSGLISKEGAAQVIAAELGVNFDKQVIKISQIVPGMKKLNLIGKIITLFPIREYNKNGKSGRIASFVLADDTSNIRTVLWDENHIGSIAEGKISQGDIVEITNGMLRNGELHLTGFSEIKLSDKSLSNLVTERPVVVKPIEQFNTNDNISARAFIVNIFEPKFFEICPECKRKVNDLKECETHGKVVSKKRALLNFIIDDGTESIRSVMFSDEIEKLISEEDLQNPEKFSLLKKDLLGKEMLVNGQIRRNKMFNNNELIISKIEEVNLDKLIGELETS